MQGWCRPVLSGSSPCEVVQHMLPSRVLPPHCLVQAATGFPCIMKTDQACSNIQKCFVQGHPAIAQCWRPEEAWHQVQAWALEQHQGPLQQLCIPMCAMPLCSALCRCWASNSRLAQVGEGTGRPHQDGFHDLSCQHVQVWPPCPTQQGTPSIKAGQPTGEVYTHGPLQF